MNLRLRKVKPQSQMHRWPTSRFKPRTQSATFCCCLRPSPDLSPHSLINADFCVGSVCVAFGAILGKVSPVQLLIMTLFQVTLFSVNEYILLSLLEVSRAQGWRFRGTHGVTAGEERKGGPGRHAGWIQFTLGLSLNLLNLSLLIAKRRVMTFIWAGMVVHLANQTSTLAEQGFLIWWFSPSFLFPAYQMERVGVPAHTPLIPSLLCQEKDPVD